MAMHQLATPIIATWPAAVDLRCVQGDSSDWATRAVIVPAVFQEWAGSVRTRLATGRRAHSVPVPEAKLQHTVLLRERRLRGGRVPEFHRDAL